MPCLALRVAPLLSLLVYLTACGGGGAESEPAVRTRTVVIDGYDNCKRIESLNDGRIIQYAEVISFLVTNDRDFLEFADIVRLYCPFDLSPVASGRVVLATLRATQESGTVDPLNPVIADHMTWTPTSTPEERFTGTGTAAVLTANLGTITSSPEPGLRILDVTEAVQRDLQAGRMASQFSVRRLDEGPDVSGYVIFARVNGQPPSLEVTVEAE